MPLEIPSVDPTPIFEIYRGNYATELLTAAVAHLHVFEVLDDRPMSIADLQNRLGLADRPCHVLVTALCAFGMLRKQNDRLELTGVAREHLLPGAPFDVSGYVGLAADNPGVREMVERLRSNRPAGEKPEEKGAAFIFREGITSAMEEEASARHLTMALAGRANNVAPILAQRVKLDSARLLLDVGGGSGIYSIACLQQNPNLRAIVWDRPEVLKVAQELAETHGVAERLECRPGDMFRDPMPAGVDVILLSNVLHDWDVPECRALIKRCADGLPSGGRLLIHDVFLNDALDGPLPITLYSAALFTLTEGRAYSALEYRTWLEEVGLTAKAIIPTLIHCGVLEGVRG